MLQYASNPNNLNIPNSTRDPLQINLRIFINPTQTQVPSAPVYQNVQPIPTLIPISHHQPLYQYSNLQYPVQNNPIMIPLNSSKTYSQISRIPIARTHITAEQYNKIVSNNQKPQQFKYIRRNFTPSNPPRGTSIRNHDNSSQEKVKKQHIHNKITQQNHYPIISSPQKQISIFCPICQKNIYIIQQQQHKQYHKNRINNKFTQIPNLQLSKQVKIDRQYTKEQLFQILMQYQQQQRLKQPKIQSEYVQNNQNNLGKYQINQNIEEEHNSYEPKGIDFYYTQQIKIANRNNQALPYRQLVSPNLSRITPDDQSQCFIQQKQIISAPYSLKNRNDILISSYQNTPINPKSEMKQTKIANYPKAQQHDFYRTVLQSHSQSQNCPKRKKLPSNKIAFEINNKN